MELQLCEAYFSTYSRLFAHPLELLLVGLIHFEEDARADVALRKRSGVCLSPDIKNMGAYCWGYLRSQTPCLEIYSASSLSCPWEAALGPGQHETFIWTCMRNPGKRRRLQTKALGTGTRERTCFWGHFFLTSPDTVTCLGDSFLYAHCPDIKELQMRVRAPLCWTLQTQNLKLLPALWTTISFYFFATDSECS